MSGHKTTGMSVWAWDQSKPDLPQSSPCKPLSSKYWKMSGKSLVSFSSLERERERERGGGGGGGGGGVIMLLCIQWNLYNVVTANLSSKATLLGPNVHIANVLWTSIIQPPSIMQS